LAEAALDSAPVARFLGSRATDEYDRRRRLQSAALVTIGSASPTALVRFALSAFGMQWVRMATRQVLSIGRAAPRGWSDTPSTVAWRGVVRQMRPSVPQRSGSTPGPTYLQPRVVRGHHGEVSDPVRLGSRLPYLASAHVGSLERRYAAGAILGRVKRARQPKSPLLPGAIRLSDSGGEAPSYSAPNRSHGSDVGENALVQFRIASPVGQPSRTGTDKYFPQPAFGLPGGAGEQSGLTQSSPARQRSKGSSARPPIRLARAATAPGALRQRAFAPSMQASQDRLAGRGLKQTQSAASSGIASNVYLDGAALGRWVTAYLEEQVSGPHAGITAVDPRLGPTFAGPPVGM
jgi:hypothetical protein